MRDHEPLIGDTLVNINLGPWQIDFDFSKALLQIGGPFLLRRKDGSAFAYTPAPRQGDVSKLWALLEQEISAAQWRDEVVILFQSGDAIEIAPGSTRNDIEQGPCKQCPRNYPGLRYFRSPAALRFLGRLRPSAGVNNSRREKIDSAFIKQDSRPDFSWAKDYWAE